MVKIKPDIGVILMTAFEVARAKLEAKLPIVKYEDVLQKPFNFMQICTAVKSMPASRGARSSFCRLAGCIPDK